MNLEGHFTNITVEDRNDYIIFDVMESLGYQTISDYRISTEDDSLLKTMSMPMTSCTSNKENLLASIISHHWEVQWPHG